MCHCGPTAITMSSVSWPLRSEVRFSGSMAHRHSQPAAETHCEVSEGSGCSHQHISEYCIEGSIFWALLGGHSQGKCFLQSWCGGPHRMQENEKGRSRLRKNLFSIPVSLPTMALFGCSRPGRITRAYPVELKSGCVTCFGQ